MEARARGRGDNGGWEGVVGLGQAGDGGQAGVDCSGVRAVLSNHQIYIRSITIIYINSRNGYKNSVVLNFLVCLLMVCWKEFSLSAGGNVLRHGCEAQSWR